MSSFADKIKNQEREAQEAGHASKSNFYKFQEGDNVFRVLSSPEMYFKNFKMGICYTDCGYEGSPKFKCYVMVKEKNLDNEDEYVIKVADLPYKIGTTIAEYEHDEDYAFTDFPMPYSIKVKAKGAGTKEVEYTVVASPNRTEVPSDILERLAKLKPVTDLIQREKDSQKEKHMADGTFQREQERKSRLQAEINQRRGLPVDTAVPPEDPKLKSVLPEYPADPYPDINPEDIPF